MLFIAMLKIAYAVTIVFAAITILHVVMSDPPKPPSLAGRFFAWGEPQIGPVSFGAALRTTIATCVLVFVLLGMATTWPLGVIMYAIRRLTIARALS